MPPHVTLIFPFADSSEVDDLLEPLGRVFAAFTPETFVVITEALVNAFPDFPPYAGEFAEIVPHITVAQGDDEVLAAAERELEAQLPVKSRVERAWLVEDTAGGWRRHTAFPLERRTSV